MDETMFGGRNLVSVAREPQVRISSLVSVRETGKSLHFHISSWVKETTGPYIIRYAKVGSLLY